MTLKNISRVLRVTLALLVTLFSANLLPSIAYAEMPTADAQVSFIQTSAPKKVWVCKYVGTPGIDERLKTGNQGLVQVSVNTIDGHDWNGNVPGWFNDKHDRSYVISYVDDKKTPPTTADCAAPDSGPTCATTIPSGSIAAAYINGSDFKATVSYTGKLPLCDGVSQTVSLNSYTTEGATWQTSGNQTFVDHQQFTVDNQHTAGTLSVSETKCYYQTDLYMGTTRFDGADGALPHYPSTVTPTNLIAWRNGGEFCLPE